MDLSLPSIGIVELVPGRFNAIFPSTVCIPTVVDLGLGRLSCVAIDSGVSDWEEWKFGDTEIIHPTGQSPIDPKAAWKQIRR